MLDLLFEETDHAMFSRVCFCPLGLFKGPLLLDACFYNICDDDDDDDDDISHVMFEINYHAAYRTEI